MKFRVAETIVDTRKNYESLKILSKKVLNKTLENLTTSQVHKFRIFSEEVNPGFHSYLIAILLFNNQI